VAGIRVRWNDLSLADVIKGIVVLAMKLEAARSNQNSVQTIIAVLSSTGNNIFVCRMMTETF
jgi:hypothetical protein